jgi:dTDP-4-amino-4,6-dideoxygalactose transaminase
MWESKKLGSIGAAGAFSFFPSKNLGGFGDGGMVATHDETIAELVRMLLKHGGKDKYNVDHIGYNARFDTLQAAIVLAKFKCIDEFNERRRNIARLYNERLSDLEGLFLPLSLPHVYHVYHQYTIRVNNRKRDDLQQFLNKNGVDTMIYYPVPLHKMMVFTGRCKVFHQAEQSEKAVKEVLSLPIEPLMEKEDVMTVIKAVRKFFTV